MPKVHLIAHAHIDPVWLWTWREGLTEAISTFRTAAEFCERHPDFVFCHNEALLYRWVEQNDPALFARIRRLVRRGRWHVMGGAFVQPDINLPSGESHVRQFLYGKRYFAQKFGARPASAWNIDSFGQAEGFPQILAGCGIPYYVFSRPRPSSWKLPSGPFRWRDRSGAEVLALRYDGSYNTRGNVAAELRKALAAPADGDGMFLWGFGDHGGGPSRREYADLRKAMRRRPELRHSTPEAFFRHHEPRRESLPAVTGELQNASPGCYTSMARVKRAHRNAESLMAVAERMAAVAWWKGLAGYPAAELEDVWREILFSQFHDMLTGTAIPTAEKECLALFGLCSETLERVQARTMISLLRGEPKAAERTVPLFVFNPHGFRAAADLEFSFTHAYKPDPKGTIAAVATLDGRRLPTQRERGELNNDFDWNMPACCHVELPPFSVRRLDIRWRRLGKPRREKLPRPTARNLRLRSAGLRVTINPRTGMVDWAGPADSRGSWLAPGALRPTVFGDGSHSWKCHCEKNRAALMSGRFGKQVDTPWTEPRGHFRLATPAEAAAVCAPVGGRRAIPPLRIVEHGPVRTVVEAILVHGRSHIVRRYVFSRRLPLFEVRDRVFWNDRSAMLKVRLPLAFAPRGTIAETPYSAAERPAQDFHAERVNLRWVKAVEKDGDRWVGAVNTGSYAHSLDGRDLYVNVLRSPLYGSGYLEAESPANEDRYIPRQDQGEHEVAFGVMFGRGGDDAPLVRAAGLFNARPAWLAFHPGGPAGRGRLSAAPPPVEVSAANVEVVALKRSEDGRDLVVRLMEHAGRATKCGLVLRGPDGRTTVRLGPYQLKTVRVRRTGRRLAFRETNLIEE